MTTRMLLQVAAKRWWIVLITFGLTALAVVLIQVLPQPTYWARTTVSVLPSAENPLRAPGYPSVALVTVLAVRTTQEPLEWKQTASVETTLYGEGVLDGSRIRVKDVGGQWYTSVPEPVIYVEAVGPTPEIVADRINQLTTKLRTNLNELQHEFKVPSGSGSYLQSTPSQPEVIQVGGSPVRATLVAVLLGAMVTVLALILVQRRWPVPLDLRPLSQDAADGGEPPTKGWSKAG